MTRHDKGTKRGAVISGLRCEPDLAAKLRDAAVARSEGNVAMLALTPTSTARHLLRLGLGMSAEVSLEREEKFSSLAQALREVREAHR